MTIATHTATPTEFGKGTVALVGAGPGDPELLTLKAVRAIASATVILVDDLVNEAVLAHANPSARITYVGKRGGCQSTKQADIEALMIEEAKKGETVVRLKGGDPMIFGRAGEELAALAQAGIACTVVNGITAALAAAQSLHVSLTHRDHARGALFVTGHAQAGNIPVDWIAMGYTVLAHKLTLVIYMGVAQVEAIASGLLVHLPAATPVAVVQAASTAQEVKKITDLASLTTTMHLHQLESPCVIVVGALAVSP